MCWGNNNMGQCNVPDSIQGNVISFDCGLQHSVALLNDNTVRYWGRSLNKQYDKVNPTNNSSFQLCTLL